MTLSEHNRFYIRKKHKISIRFKDRKTLKLKQELGKWNTLLHFLLIY